MLTIQDGDYGLMKVQQVEVKRVEQPSWIKDWYVKQEQMKRLIETYQNHEMEAEHGQKMSCLV